MVSMRRVSLRCAAAAALALLPPTAASARPVTGRVLDERGRPAANIEVASSWTLDDRRLVAKPFLTTDRDGRFSGDLPIAEGRGFVLMALDKARQRGGIARVEQIAADAPVEIRLAPLVSVRGAFDVSAMPRPAPRTVRLDVLAAPGGMNLAATEWNTATFALKLPPGKYDLWASVEGAERVRRAIDLAPGARPLELDDLVLRPTRLNALLGKPPPPWTVTEARGAPASVRLEDYRGRWVLLEFWGFW